MREFIITSDSTVDLPIEYLEEQGNIILSLSYILDGETYEDLKGLPSKEFYEKLREGALPTTSQVNPDQAKDAFKKIIEQGKDILHIGFSSGLSGSYNSARIAAEELKELYPEATIIVIDSLCAAIGEGLLLYRANSLKAEGKTIVEVEQWVNENHLHVSHNFTVNDLNHLHRGGRISKAAAVLGTMINIKPILEVDAEGKLVQAGKVRGRKKSLIYLVDQLEKQKQSYDNSIIMIGHGDCVEDAEFVKAQVMKRFGITNVMIHPVGSVIGTHTGPGMVALCFMGDKRKK